MPAPAPRLSLGGNDAQSCCRKRLDVAPPRSPCLAGSLPDGSSSGDPEAALPTLPPASGPDRSWVASGDRAVAAWTASGGLTKAWRPRVWEIGRERIRAVLTSDHYADMAAEIAVSVLAPLQRQKKPLAAFSRQLNSRTRSTPTLGSLTPRWPAFAFRIRYPVSDLKPETEILATREYPMNEPRLPEGGDKALWSSLEKKRCMWSATTSEMSHLPAPHKTGFFETVARKVCTLAVPREIWCAEWSKRSPPGG